MYIRSSSPLGFYRARSSAQRFLNAGSESSSSPLTNHMVAAAADLPARVRRALTMCYVLYVYSQWIIDCRTRPYCAYVSKENVTL